MVGGGGGMVHSMYSYLSVCKGGKEGSNFSCQLMHHCIQGGVYIYIYEYIQSALLLHTDQAPQM